MSDSRYQWWDVTQDGVTRHTVFRMRNSVQEDYALFTVPSIKLADQVTYALRTAYYGGLTCGQTPQRVPDTERLTRMPHRIDNSEQRHRRYAMPERAYTIHEIDRHGMRTDATSVYQRPAIILRTRKLARELATELDSAYLAGIRRGTEARHNDCHGHDGPCPNRKPSETLCANCGRYGRVSDQAEYAANCDRHETVWLTTEASDWREGDKLCARCVASFTWDPAEWRSETRPDGITVYTRI